MKRALLVVALLVLLAAPLALAFRDFGQLVSAEVVRIAWTVRLLLEGLPQAGLWGALLALVLITALSSLVDFSQPAAEDDDRPVEAVGRVWEISQRLRRAAMGTYARWALQRYLEDLVFEAMAARRGGNALELKRRFRAGQLAVDPDIAAFLEEAAQRRFRVPRRPGNWLRRLLRGEHGDRPEIPTLERVVEFIEGQLAPGPAPHISREAEGKHEHDAG